ncbi:MAG TPA: hypothetical protein VFB45_10710 [Pseudolabrys sp.]|nr:hypothetical protein [Pseudolabrys sp.]
MKINGTHASLAVLALAFALCEATPAAAYCDRPSYFHVPGMMMQWDTSPDCSIYPPPPVMVVQPRMHRVHHKHRRHHAQMREH